jgi:transposase
VFADWLAAQTPAIRAGIETVAMDGFTGFRTATAETIPRAAAVMDPFHVVALAGNAVDRCRQRVQQEIHGHRGRSGDPLHGIRHVLNLRGTALGSRNLANYITRALLDTGGCRPLLHPLLR